ncbi:hypothetical protein DFQ28_005507 [Apophysomyces sp. BC1034]|nr:hypothetical protein DFQ29_004475 [Apophysomyces sp. BC1021]KAG0187995.1 hypothetical protein DFQ28_005507 [Apophysomyces sp. BC1034]
MEPEPNADILQIRNLPNDTVTKRLYELFRPFGPMKLCNIIVEQGVGFKGTALVQYFDAEDAENAETTMNHTNIQGNIITVFPYVPKKMRSQSADPDDRLQLPVDTSTMINSTRHSMNDSGTMSRSSGDATNTVDYTNLYIKNLDLNVKSSDLFNHFRRFGRIISARVMKNAQTKQSKGFGFVSFSKAEEALRALHEMNNQHIMSKPVIVAFHEPKKTRTDKPSPVSLPSPHPAPLSFSPPMPNSFDHQYYRSHDLVRRCSSSGAPSSYPTPPSIPQAQEYMSSSPASTVVAPFPSPYSQPPRPYGNSYFPDQSIGGMIQNLPTIINDKANINKPNVSVAPPVAQAASSPLTFCPPSLSNLASGAYINAAPSTVPTTQYKMTSQGRPTLRRRGSIESASSIMTEATSSIQKQRMVNVILKSGETRHVEDIADMLLTLKCRERSLCLFNPDYLKSKILQAKNALEIFQEEEEDDDDDDNENQSFQNTMPTNTEQRRPPEVPKFMMDVSLPPRTSRAIPIVAPPPEEKSKEAALTEEVDQFLKSLEGLVTHEKKQRLGDRLFPLVKATGVRHAPKITIRLLDSVPLNELAHSMYYDDKLKQRVESVVASLQS